MYATLHTCSAQRASAAISCDLMRWHRGSSARSPRSIPLEFRHAPASTSTWGAYLRPSGFFLRKSSIHSDVTDLGRSRGSPKPRSQKS